MKTGGVFALAEKPVVSWRYSGIAVVIALFAVMAVTLIILLPILADVEMGKGAVCARGFAAGVLVSLFFVYATVSDRKVRDTFLRKAEASLRDSCFRDVEIKMRSSYTSCTFTARQCGTRQYAKYRIKQLTPLEYEWELIL